MISFNIVLCKHLKKYYENIFGVSNKSIFVYNIRQDQIIYYFNRFWKIQEIPRRISNLNIGKDFLTDFDYYPLFKSHILQ